MRFHALLIVAAGLLLAADTPKGDVAKKDMEKLQGDWVLVSGTRNGEKFPDEAAKSLKRTIKDGVITVTRDGNTLATVKFTIDPTKKPKAIDLSSEQGEMKGIYEFDGDTCKMCYAEDERPTEFSSKAGSMRTLAVWRKEKK